VGSIALKLSTTLRSTAYKAYTKIPHGFMRKVRESTGAQALDTRIQSALAHGEVQIASGLARGLFLDTAAFRPSHIQAHGLIRGTLESHVQYAFMRSVTPGSCVYDVGANLGFFTLIAARLVGPTGHVHAFEPVAATAQSLASTVDRNGFTHVSVHMVAVNDVSGEGRLLRTQESSWSHLDDRGWHPQTAESVPVSVISLDDFVRDGGRPPDFVKIDVEGSEVAVLEGAIAILAEHRPQLVIELHETNREVMEFMSDIGYRARGLDGTSVVAQSRPGHILASPLAQPSRQT
jgi:FkbM family methyltransferase